MRRGDLFRVRKPHRREPKASRCFVVISRQVVIDSAFSTVICAPVYSSRHGLASQVLIDGDQGVKHASAIHCDELVSLPKAALTDFIGALAANKMAELDTALAVAVGIG